MKKDRVIELLEEQNRHFKEQIKAADQREQQSQRLICELTSQVKQLTDAVQSLEEALTHYLYAQTSAIVTNCVKTIPLSQTSGQQLLSGCYGEFDEILKDVMNRSEEDLCLSAPGFDIRGIQHEKLYSRLYMS